MKRRQKKFLFYFHSSSSCSLFSSVSLEAPQLASNSRFFADFFNFRVVYVDLIQNSVYESGFQMTITFPDWEPPGVFFGPKSLKEETLRPGSCKT